MKRLLLFVLCFFICNPSWAIVYCKRFPTDTAVPCYGPDYPPPGGGSGNVGIGTAGEPAYYVADGTTVSPFINVHYVGSNVGIGSNAPGKTLDVQGSIRASTNIGVGTYNVCTTSGNCPSSGGTGTAVTDTITQTSHGFSVGNVVKLTGTDTYALARCDTAANCEAVGIVSSVTDANTFVLTTHGYVTGLSGLTTATAYFISPTSAGVLTATAPTTPGQISKPVFVSTSTTAGYFINYRGMAVTTGSSGNVNSGTINQVTKYASTGTAVSGSSILFDTATNVGIGTSVPISLFDVNRKLNVLSGGNVGIGSLVPISTFNVLSIQQSPVIINTSYSSDNYLTYQGGANDGSGHFNGLNIEDQNRNSVFAGIRSGNMEFQAANGHNIFNFQDAGLGFNSSLINAHSIALNGTAWVGSLSDDTSGSILQVNGGAHTTTLAVGANAPTIQSTYSVGSAINYPTTKNVYGYNISSPLTICYDNSTINPLCFNYSIFYETPWSGGTGVASMTGTQVGSNINPIALNPEADPLLGNTLAPVLIDTPFDNGSGAALQVQGAISSSSMAGSSGTDYVCVDRSSGEMFASDTGC